MFCFVFPICIVTLNMLGMGGWVFIICLMEIFAWGGVKLIIQENKPIIYAKTSEGFDDSLHIQIIFCNKMILVVFRSRIIFRNEFVTSR